jgi:class 3 adenylate cyclase
VANFISKLGQAISAAHDVGVYHRDLKPENILLCGRQAGEETEEYVKVIDFGISIVKGSLDEKTRSTVAAGSIRYMAPEQLSGKATKLSDIYAMGLIAYEVITGRLPFNTEEGSRLMAARRLLELQAAGVRVKARDLRPTIPVSADEAILKALSYNPSKRFQRADEFGQELARALMEADQTDSQAETGHESSRTLEMAYVLFMEIVDYATLPIDVQTSCIEEFQSLVRETKAFRKAISTDRLISLPTGAAMALAFFGDPIAAVQCAIQASLALKQYPHIALRMGINAGPVYRIQDINSNQNIAGGGLTLAKAVTDYADSGHILLSQSMADVVSQVSEWKAHLVDFGVQSLTHDGSVHLFNLCTGDAGKPDLPSKLRSTATVPVDLNRKPTFGRPTTAEQKHQERTRRFLTVSVVAILVVALAGLGWWYRSVNKANVPDVDPSRATTTETRPRVRTLSYWGVLQPYRKEKPFGEPIQLTGGIAGETYFNSGDLIRFFVTSADDGHLYLINEESPGKYNVIFPSPEGNGQSSEVKANAAVGTSQCSFDASTGTEKVWIVWSVDAIDELERSTRLWGNASDQGEIKDSRTADSISKLFKDGSATKIQVEPDTANKRINLRGQGDVLVYVLKLIHR